MHSRKHGKSGSKKPVKKIKSDWLIYDKNEIEALIEKLAKEGHTSAQIGLILRDQYGIPDVREFELRVNKVKQKSVKTEVPEDLFSLIRRAVVVNRHLGSNKKDTKAKHGLILMESKIRRLGKYYLRKGILPKGWKYTIEYAKLLVK